MRSLLARLAVLGAFAVATTACTNGSGGALPFAGPPNNAGGSQGQFQSGSNGTSLLRFIQGSPDPSITGPAGAVDICIDDLPFGVLAPSVAYGTASGLFAVGAGIGHTVAVYNHDVAAANAGLECPTAPGPYIIKSPLAVTTITPGISSRWTIVLGGITTSTPSTFGLYVFAEPTYAIPPAGFAVTSHNAAPAFSIGKANGVGFGQCTTTVTPCATAVNLIGAQGRAAPAKSATGGSTQNGTVTSGINGIPAGFYDGIGVAAGTVVPITSIAAPNALAGQPYVILLYAIDAPAGGLNLVAAQEQTLGYSF